MAAFIKESTNTGVSNQFHRIDFAERLESLKSGSCGAVFSGLAFGMVAWVNAYWMPNLFSLTGLQYFNGLGLLISGTIAVVSGFLFGVTYRYIIRLDQNPHLKSGAVLAFGLVRGLGQVEVGLHRQTVLLPWLILVGESILLFAITRLGLDWLLAQNWVKPFSTSNLRE